MGVNPTIANAQNVPLNVQTGSIPNVGGTLLDWFQPMVFTKVVKQVIAFQLVETSVNINFWGITFPLSGRELKIQPEGERKWNLIRVVAQDSPEGALISLLPDEVITYLNVQYRVMASRNYSIYGYIEMDLVQDYTGSGPLP